MRISRTILGLTAALAVMGLGSVANAAMLFTSSNGWSSASVSQTGTTLTVALTNSFANPVDSQMLSGFELNFDTAPLSATSFTQAGQLVTIASNGTYTNIAGSPTHWGSGLSGSSLIIETVGPFAVGGQPFNLITSGSSDSNTNPGVTNFNPYILGTGTFAVVLPSGYDALAHISSVGFQWSTTSGFTTGVPEPATWAMLAL